MTEKLPCGHAAPAPIRAVAGPPVLICAICRRSFVRPTRAPTQSPASSIGGQ